MTKEQAYSNLHDNRARRIDCGGSEFFARRIISEIHFSSGAILVKERIFMHVCIVLLAQQKNI